MTHAATYRINAQGNRVSSRKGRSSSWCAKDKRLAIYIRDEFACAYCGRDLRNAPARELTLDHLVCRVDGGSNAESNLVLACLACNSGRSDLVKWYNYATPGAVQRIRKLVRRKLNRNLAKAIIAGHITREQALTEAAH
jgi:5-methylcytosine-specific restriction endonuclease McrA